MHANSPRLFIEINKSDYIFSVCDNFKEQNSKLIINMISKHNYEKLKDQLNYFLFYSWIVFFEPHPFVQLILLISQ